MTPRERQVLLKLGEGLSTETIAGELFISPVTVRNHIARVLVKLGVHSRLAAVTLAMRAGLLLPGGQAGTRRRHTARRLTR